MPTTRPLAASSSHANSSSEPRAADRIADSTCSGAPVSSRRSPVTIVSWVALTGGSLRSGLVARDRAARAPRARLERERALWLAEPAEALGADRLAPLVARAREVRAGRTDREAERAPEVVEAGVVRARDEDRLLDALEPRAPEPLGDVTVLDPRPHLLPDGAGVHGPHRGPERAQHRHAAARDVPHAERDRAARPGHPRHLTHPRVGVAHEADNERGERGVEGAVLPWQILRSAVAHVGGGEARAAGLGELRRRIDRGHPLGARALHELAVEAVRTAAHVEHAHPGPPPGGVGERRRERRQVAPHEAVVVLGGRGELHAPQATPPLTGGER